MVFAELGPPAYALKARVQLLRDLGSAASPFNAFLVAQGLETLSLRVERHVANAQRVAEYLAGHDERAVGELRRACPARRGTSWQRSWRPREPARCWRSSWPAASTAGKAFVDALTLHSHVANIGDVRSLVIHPASTTHAQLSPPRSSWPPASPRVWCGWRSASRASTTSSPTSSTASPRRGNMKLSRRLNPAGIVRP